MKFTVEHSKLPDDYQPLFQKLTFEIIEADPSVGVLLFDVFTPLLLALGHAQAEINVFLHHEECCKDRSMCPKTAKLTVTKKKGSAPK